MKVVYSRDLPGAVDWKQSVIFQICLATFYFLFCCRSRFIKVRITRSHGVRECCKGDDESLWDRGNFDPLATHKNPQPMSPKFA